MPVTPSISFSFDGALFHVGREAKIIRDFMDSAVDEVSQQAFANVHMFLDLQIVDPTPYYETQIIKERALGDIVIHDRGIIYGPWLEGDGSKNRPRPGFPGYHSFRKANQKTDSEAGRIVQAVLRRYIERM